MEKDTFQKLRALIPEIKKNVLLKNYTSFRIGGPAKYFFTAGTKEELVEAIRAAKKNSLSFFIFGGGSNLLVSDKGFEGLVIEVKSQKSKVKSTTQKSKVIEAGAGTPLGQLVNLALKDGLTGLEWAIGIPGTVGGAIYGNVGAFGGSMADIVESVEVLDIRDVKNPKSKIQIPNPKGKPSASYGAGKFQIPNSKIFQNRKCKFGYRDSIFKKNKDLIILSAILELKKGDKREIKNKVRRNLEQRKRTQPLGFPSAGSIFKNFTLRRPAPEKSRCGTGAGPKLFPEFEKFKKTGIIPAGYLIERCGLKGKRIGQVQISETHANFIVNLGNGKAGDVMELIKLIKKEVKNKFKIELKKEIKLLGAI